MPPYALASVPPLTIGAGARHLIGAIASALAGREAAVLLVADPGLEPLGVVGELEASLAEDGFRVTRFTDLKSDPTVAQADAATALARRSGALLVVGLGGGSALDLAKAVAAIAGETAPAATYALGAAPLPHTRLKTVLLPTTAGTGAETTRVAILSDPDGAKLWFYGEELRADHAILDPELTRSLPAGLTVATGLDALVHAVEAATNRRATPGNDVVAHEAIRLVARCLPVAVAQPGDLAAREGLLRAAALAGTAIDNAGTAAAHAIGHALASLRPIHHGRAVTMAMLGSMRWVVGQDREGRFAACAAAMGQEASGPGFLTAFEDLTRRVGFMPDMSAFADVTPERLAAQIARPENRPMMRATARDADDGDLLGLARSVLELR